jgi:hypothetical protein
MFCFLLSNESTQKMWEDILCLYNKGEAKDKNVLWNLIFIWLGFAIMPCTIFIWKPPLSINVVCI